MQETKSKTNLLFAKAINTFHKIWRLSSLILIYYIILAPKSTTVRIASFFIITSTMIADFLFNKYCPFMIMERYLKRSSNLESTKSRTADYMKKQFGMNLFQTAITIIVVSALITTGLCFIIF
jgi:hypothetical protein